MGSYYSLGSYFCYMFDVSDFRILDFYSEGIWIWLQWVSFLLKGSFCCFPIWQDCSIIWENWWFALSRDRKSRETLTSAADPDGTNNLSGWRVRSLIMKSHNFEPAEWLHHVTTARGCLTSPNQKFLVGSEEFRNFLKKKMHFFIFFKISIASIILL